MGGRCDTAVRGILVLVRTQGIFIYTFHFDLLKFLLGVSSPLKLGGPKPWILQNYRAELYHILANY